jgi:hypothetical protein
MKLLTVFLVCLASIAWAEDITTTSGKVYKHTTVTRVEPDGLVIKFAGGVVKIPFTELSKELQQRYDYDPEAAANFRAQNAAAVGALNEGWSGKCSPPYAASSKQTCPLTGLTKFSMKCDASLIGSRRKPTTLRRLLT